MKKLVILFLFFLPLGGCALLPMACDDMNSPGCKSNIHTYTWCRESGGSDTDCSSYKR